MIRVGQRLEEERVRQGLSVAEVAKATKIRPQFLTSIEKGEYKLLPSSAYVHGFIRNYAEFLGMPVKNTLALFRREFDEREYLGVLPESFTKKHASSFPGFRLGPTALLLGAIVLFVIGYVFFQYRSAFLSPQLSIGTPKENATVAAQVISVVGKTEQNISVTVNDDPVYVEKDGSFMKDVTVFSGPNAITVKAINSFGKKSIVIRHITVR